MGEKEISGLDITIRNKKYDDMYPLCFGVSCAFFALQFLSRPHIEDERWSKIRDNMLLGSSHLLGLIVWKVQKEDQNGMRREIEDLKKMRREDGKANEKVVSIFAAQEQDWLKERKKLRQHIGALMNELRVFEKRKEESVSELNKKLEEMEVLAESREKAFREEEEKRKETEEKMMKAEREAEELRENVSQETAFIDRLLKQKEESDVMTQKLFMEIAKLHKDLEQKGKVLSAMLRKSELDSAEKKMLLKEVKSAEARRKQAEQETEKWRAVSDGRYKRHSLRNMLVNLGSTRLSHSSKEPEHFSSHSDHYLRKSFEELAITGNGKRLEDWVKAEAENNATMIEKRHHLELNAFAEELSNKDEKLEAFHWQLLRMELETTKLQSHVEGLMKEVTQLGHDKMKLETLLMEREERLTSLKEKFTSHLKSFNCHEHNLHLPTQSSKSGEKEQQMKETLIVEDCEEEEVQSPENDVHYSPRPMQKQGLSEADVDVAENIALTSQSSNKGNHSAWKMDLHAVGVSYKIKRLKQQLVLVERLTVRQANGETTEINDDRNKASVKTFLSLTSLLNKHVGMYQSLQEKIDSLCKWMHENNIYANRGDLGAATTKEKTETLEEFLEETFQLQRYIVGTGQKWLEIQSKIVSGFAGVAKEIEKSAGIDMKRFADSVRNLSQEVQRGLEIRTARIIGDLEGTLTCKGTMHLRR